MNSNGQPETKTIIWDRDLHKWVEVHPEDETTGHTVITIYRTPAGWVTIPE